MRVTIRPDATTNSAEFNDLDRIIYRILDGAHEWEVDFFDELENSAWMKSSPRILEIFRGEVKKSAYPRTYFFSRKLHVCKNPLPNASPDELTPKQARLFVDKPLTILMENNGTDGVLLDTAMEFIAPELFELYSKRETNLLEYAHAGGIGEIPRLVTKFKDEAQQLTIPVRLIVFTDSDGLIPGQVAQNPQLARQHCVDAKIQCCILSKRSIENYIPDVVFDLWVSDRANTSSRKKIEVLKRFTPSQRDHFLLKDGFKNPNAHDAQLYATLTSNDRAEWAIGLGHKVIERLRECKNDLSAQVLTDRDHTGDLKKIITMIMSEL